MTAPVVSVVMAAYNGERRIAETLASLSSQKLTDFEVLVVDDCSTDGTRDVVRQWRDPRVRLIETDVNGGPVRARNRAFAQARGRYIAGLDQDDICLPERLARQVAWLERHPTHSMVAANTIVVENGVERAAPHAAVTTPALVGWLLHIQNPLVWSTAMIRGSAARRLSLFTDPERLYAEDFDLYHRLLAIGPVARIDDVLLRYRDHPGGASQRYRETMVANAGAVLLRAWTPIVGDHEAITAAALLARPVVAGEAVPDAATLALLGATIARLQSLHIARTAPTGESLRLIRLESARLWWRIVRHAVRSGAIPLHTALAVRPQDFGPGTARLDDVILSGVVGTVRAAALRLQPTQSLG